MVDADGFVYGPTPLEAADHIEAGGALMWQDAWDGVWAASNMSADRWRARTNPDAPRHAYRLVPLPVVPPVPVVVKVEDANDAQALIGRSIDGVEIDRAPHDEHGFCGLRMDAFGEYGVVGHWSWGESVTVDPEPPPAPVEPDTVGVIEAARALVADIERRFSPNGEIRSSEALTGLRAALAAEGDRR